MVYMAGTPTKMVAPTSSMVFSIFRGSNELMNIPVRPALNAMIPRPNPNRWARGSAMSPMSLGPVGINAAVRLWARRRLREVIIAPLGNPVVPEV